MFSFKRLFLQTILLNSIKRQVVAKVTTRCVNPIEIAVFKVNIEQRNFKLQLKYNNICNYFETEIRKKLKKK